jgi:putative ABC transport system permease protein
MIPYLLSQFFGRMLRTSSVVFGIGMGTCIFLALTALGNGYSTAAKMPLSGVESDVILNKSEAAENNAASMQKTRGIRMPFGIASITMESISNIEKLEDIQAVSPVLQLWEFDANSYRTILGVDMNHADPGPGNYLQEGVIKGRGFEANERSTAVVDRHYAAFYGIKPGSELTLGDQTFEVVGIVNQSNTNQTTAANIYIPLQDAQVLAGVSNEVVNQAFIRIADAGNLDHVVHEISSLDNEYNIITEDSMVQVMGGIGKVSARFSTAAAAVGLVGGLLLSWFALQGMVNERRKEIAIMKALGWQKRQIFKVFIVESIVLSFIGCLLGLGLGWGSAWGLQALPMPDISTTQDIQGLIQVKVEAEQTTLPVYLTRNTVLFAFGVVMLCGIIASWSGARRWIQFNPATALRDR